MNTRRINLVDNRGRPGWWDIDAKGNFVNAHHCPWLWTGYRVSGEPTPGEPLHTIKPGTNELIVMQWKVAR